MNIWHDINPNRIKSDDFIAVIEIKKVQRKNMNLIKKQA